MAAACQVNRILCSWKRRKEFLRARANGWRAGASHNARASSSVAHFILRALAKEGGYGKGGCKIRTTVGGPNKSRSSTAPKAPPFQTARPAEVRNFARTARAGVPATAP